MYSKVAACLLGLEEIATQMSTTLIIYMQDGSNKANHVQKQESK